jgi:hypothetical protein
LSRSALFAAFGLAINSPAEACRLGIVFDAKLEQPRSSLPMFGLSGG